MRLDGKEKYLSNFYDDCVKILKFLIYWSLNVSNNSYFLLSCNVFRFLLQIVKIIVSLYDLVSNLQAQFRPPLGLAASSAFHLAVTNVRTINFVNCLSSVSIYVNPKCYGIKTIYIYIPLYPKSLHTGGDKRRKFYIRHSSLVLETEIKSCPFCNHLKKSGSERNVA